MQFIFLIVILIALVAFIIYKINKKFETKEIFILLVVILIPILSLTFYLRNQEEKVPNIFKEKYEKEKDIKILKLSFDRLNNKNISSKTEFIYDFDYIIKKEDKEFACNLKNVKIKKIEDEYVFENFHNLIEKCGEK